MEIKKFISLVFLILTFALPHHLRAETVAEKIADLEDERRTVRMAIEHTVREFKEKKEKILKTFETKLKNGISKDADEEKKKLADERQKLLAVERATNAHLERVKKIQNILDILRQEKFKNFAESFRAQQSRILEVAENIKNKTKAEDFQAALSELFKIEAEEWGALQEINLEADRIIRLFAFASEDYLFEISAYKNFLKEKNILPAEITNKLQKIAQSLALSFTARYDSLHQNIESLRADIDIKIKSDIESRVEGSTKPKIRQAKDATSSLQFAESIKDRIQTIRRLEEEANDPLQFQRLGASYKRHLDFLSLQSDCDGIQSTGERSWMFLGCELYRNQYSRSQTYISNSLMNRLKVRLRYFKTLQSPDLQKLTRELEVSVNGNDLATAIERHDLIVGRL